MQIRTVEEKRTVTNFYDDDFKIKLSDIMGLCARLFVGATLVIHDESTYKYCSNKGLINTLKSIDNGWECKKGEYLDLFFTSLVTSCKELNLEDVNYT